MWIDELENPEAVRKVFETAPTLDNVEITSVTMDREGPTVVLTIALKEVPSKSSPKWQRMGMNAVTLSLQLLAVENLSLEGWATHIIVKVDITRERNNGLRIWAVGPSIRLTCLCRFIRVRGITP